MDKDINDIADLLIKTKSEVLIKGLNDLVDEKAEIEREKYQVKDESVKTKVTEELR